MFGVVPKTLWNRVVPCDEQNRVTIGLNTLVVRTRVASGTHTTVIETGFGEKLSPRVLQISGAQAKLPQAFAQAGIPLESVDTVINTHLHWDHCGWNTRYAPGSSPDAASVVPTCPNATYFAHAGEVAHGRMQTERDAISYVPENYEPLLASGQMQQLETAPGQRKVLAPGISVELFPGHTHQMMAVHIEDGASHACYISDLIPTAAHLPLVWGMGFDLDPMRLIAEKKRFYGHAIPEKWLVVFTHEPGVPLGYLDAAPRSATLRAL
jgi:glyoxylase-like metal-dependent hydrolase (beta-lactamase superfamily II)